METRRPFPIAPLITGLILCAALLPWLVVQWNRSVNGNVAWLSICAQRWLNAQDTLFSDICYDTNPPLSILLYTPPAYLSALTGLEQYYAIYICVIILIALSVINVILILKKFSFFSLPEKLVIVSSYILSITLISSISFADKDHIISILVLPYALAQLSITWRLSIHKYAKYSSLILGTLAILIKPHYVLVSLLFLSHRAWLQKRWRLILDADSILIVAFPLIYAAILGIWFQDFLTVMLPDIVRYYLPYLNQPKTYSDLRNFSVWIIVALTLAALAIDKEKYKSDFLFLMTFCALIGLLVYYMQMKGLDYQLLPVFQFLLPSLALGLHAALKKYLSKPGEILIGLGVILSFVTYAYYRAPLRLNYPTHQDYKNSELAKYIEQNCGTPCSFMVTHENMEIASQIGFYIKGKYATRFPGYWFIPIMEGTPFPDKGTATISPEIQKERTRFAGYVAQDIKSFKPSLIMVLTTPAQGSTKSAFDYFDYFSLNPEFQKEVKNYKSIEEFSTDRSYFFRDTRHDYRYILTWKVYKHEKEKIE